MATYSELRRAKELGLNLTDLLVSAYVAENGPAPIGRLAEAVGCSERTVERSLSQLKAHGLLQKKTTKMTHDHADHGSYLKGTTSTVTAVSDTAVAKSDDPLAERLLGYGILPWCVETLLAKVPRDVIETQLAYHDHRLARGFAFTGHPARYLFRACLNGFQPPADFHEVKHQHAEQLPVKPAKTRQAPREVQAPAAAEPVPLTRDGAMTIIRMGLRSKLPRMREEALSLARTWGVDIDTLAPTLPASPQSRFG